MRQVALAGLVERLAHKSPQGEADLPPEPIRLLAGFGDKAVPALAEALRNPDLGIRLGAVCVFQTLRTADSKVLAALREFYKGKIDVLREAAGKALVANGQPLPEP